MAKRFTGTAEFAAALQAAGVIGDPNEIARVIIDVNPAEGVQVYVQRVAGPQLPEVAGLLGEMMRDGRAASPPVRYWVAVSSELMASTDIVRGLGEAGLRIAEFGPWRDIHTRMVRVEDPGALPALEGQEVDLEFGSEDGRPVITRRTPRYPEDLAMPTAPAPGEPCCDLHGRNCEPPSELCCEHCTEARHAGWTDDRGVQRLGHPAGELCASPDLSGTAMLWAS